MKMTFTINGSEFKTKKALEAYARSLLYSHNINEPLVGADFEFMYDYFKIMHLEFDIKEGCGIQSIIRIKEPLYGKHRGFKIVRKDGSETDISYILSSISKKNLFRDLKEALRQAIEPQVKAFKVAQLLDNPQIRCPFTDESLSYGYSHVDHYSPTFHELVLEFKSMQGLDELRMEEIISKPIDNQLLAEITDDEIRQKFWEFHQDRANLRLLSPLGNLSHAKVNVPG